MVEGKSPAEVASQIAIEQMNRCLSDGQSFVFEAGAGAGKTYSLVQALSHLVKKNQKQFSRRGKKIACITYTNVAKDEIAARIDHNPIVFCDTNHAFCWSLVSSFQKQLRVWVESASVWETKLAEVGGVGDRRIEYGLGYRSIRSDVIYLHHDDVIPSTIFLLAYERFRKIIVERYPIILIDEYQDTDENWIGAIKTYFFGARESPLFGFFGDHWQRIYGNGCGKIEHPSIEQIGKEANFRSVSTIVDCLNRMRPELPQKAVDPNSVGEVLVFHTNSWDGVRLTGAHWAGDLPHEVSTQYFDQVKSLLISNQWNLAIPDTKILMLTHKMLSREQGYSNLAEVFKFPESLIKKENKYIAYFVDVLDPGCDAFAEKRFGEMFELFGKGLPLIKRHADKVIWFESMSTLLRLRETGTVSQIIEHLKESKHPELPDSLLDMERRLNSANRDEDFNLRELLEIENLHQIKYEEVRAFRRYSDGFSPFETKHGVKGAEFENCFVVFGRGWNHYNFGEMLEYARNGIPAGREVAYERNRNLFYVACSRPKKRLAILFTQYLTSASLETLKQWFGVDSVRAL